MCGIAGIISGETDLPLEETRLLLKKMSSNIAHRGPDGHGVLVRGRAGFAHRRLAIIDLNERSNQPMQTADGGLVIVFNGEIYNFLDLRSQLQTRGYRFSTASDTEVLLHGYREWGSDLPRRLRGMFAFVIWDAKRQEAFIARDRFGKKPFFYYKDGPHFLFGSDIKSLLEWPRLERAINYASLHDYMTFGYSGGEQTVFEGIFRLPPAHSMLIRPGRDTVIQRYWSLPLSCDEPTIDIKEASQELIERFDEALRIRLLSDVPIGAFLSGGLDSSSVVARMSQFVSEPLKTFSVGFAEDGYDETQYARSVAKQYGTDHRSFVMDSKIIDELPQIIWHYGEPFDDSSALACYSLAREAEKSVKVVLSGDGGDETLLGYSRYQRLQDAIVKSSSGKNVPKAPTAAGASRDQANVRDIYGQSICKFSDSHKLEGYGPAMAPYLLVSSIDSLGTSLEDASQRNAMELAARVDTTTYLPYDLLVKTDIATMAHGLECRSPFLDHELVEWASQLPQKSKVFSVHGELQTKALLKRAMEAYLPKRIIYRRKQGFSVPVKHWMRREMKTFLIDTLTSTRYTGRGVIEPKYMLKMIDEHMAGVADHGTRLWNQLCFELWAQTFIDKADTSALSIGPIAYSR